MNKLIVFVFLITLKSFAGEFNFGLGVISLRTNHYRGSDQEIDYHFPMPYIYYQGEKIKADNGIINGKFFDSRFLSIQLTMSAGPRVEQEENDARQGMPELLWNMGIGPMAVIHIIRSDNFILQIEHAIRREFETDFSYTRGFGTTNVTYLTIGMKGETWSFEYAIGKLHGDQDYHNYYYGIEPEYATADRPIYNATSGNSGIVQILAIKKQLGDFMLFPFARYDNIENAVFTDSPLVKKERYLMVGIGMFYLLF